MEKSRSPPKRANKKPYKASLQGVDDEAADARLPLRRHHPPAPAAFSQRAQQCTEFLLNVCEMQSAARSMTTPRHKEVTVPEAISRAHELT